MITLYVFNNIYCKLRKLWYLMNFLENITILLYNIQENTTVK